MREPKTAMWLTNALHFITNQLKITSANCLHREMLIIHKVESQVKSQATKTTKQKSDRWKRERSEKKINRN